MKLIDVIRVPFAGELNGTLRRRRDVGACHLAWPAVYLRDEDNLDSKTFEHACSRRAVTFRHDGNKRVAKDVADNGQASTQVAAGHLDDGLTRFEFAGFASILNDAKGCAILDAATRLHKLGFAEYLSRPRKQTVEGDKRRKADKVKRVSRYPQHFSASAFVYTG